MSNNEFTLEGMLLHEKKKANTLKIVGRSLAAIALIDVVQSAFTGQSLAGNYLPKDSGALAYAPDLILAAVTSYAELSARSVDSLRKSYGPKTQNILARRYGSGYS